MKPQSSRVLGPESATRRCGVVVQLKGMGSSGKTSWELSPFMSSEDIFLKKGLEFEIGLIGHGGF